MSWRNWGVFSMLSTDDTEGVKAAAAEVLDDLDPVLVTTPGGVMLTDLAVDPSKYMPFGMLIWGRQGSRGAATWTGPGISDFEAIRDDDDYWRVYGRFMAAAAIREAIWPWDSALVMLSDERDHEPGRGVLMVELSLRLQGQTPDAEWTPLSAPDALAIRAWRSPLGWFGSHESPDPEEAIKHTIGLA